MKVFETVPADFFSVLVSPNREIYVDALMKLYEMFQAEINIRLKAFLAEVELLLEDRQYVMEEGDDAEEFEFTSLRGKARLIEHRLEKTRWIEREYLDGSFTEIITPYPYAIIVMRMLDELTRNGAAEYNSLVFSTYSALNQAYTNSRDRMYEALLIAKNNTEKLDYELRTFYHGIRGYLRIIRENSDVNRLLQNHFEAYKKEADRVYHPIKTMDSLSRYSGPICNILTEVRYDDDLLRQMTQKALVTKNYPDEEDAREDILNTIEKIVDSYQAIRQLVDEIDLKHSSLTKQSVDKIRYVMSADQSIKGKLVELMKVFAQAVGERETAVTSMLQEHIQVNRQDYIDKGSLWHKNIRSRRIDAPPMTLPEDSGVEEEVMAAVSAKMKNGYSEARVRSFMEGLFADDQKEVSSEHIPVENDTDYILTLLAVVSAFKGRRGYSVKLEDGFMLKDQYRIPRFVLYKGGKPNVE